MALDEPKDQDSTYDVDGLTFLVEKDLFNYVGDIKIDFVEAGFRSGFSISSAKPLAAAGGSCASSCGSSGGSCAC